MTVTDSMGIRDFSAGETCGSSGCHASASPSPDLLFNAQTGVTGIATYQVQLAVEGYTNGGSFAATVDPMITFAPGFDSTGWTLEVSADPPGTVPEPGTMFLLPPVLAIVAAVRRKRLLEQDAFA
jgi:hypothetical protein